MDKLKKALSGDDEDEEKGIVTQVDRGVSRQFHDQLVVISGSSFHTSQISVTVCRLIQ